MKINIIDPPLILVTTQTPIHNENILIKNVSPNIFSFIFADCFLVHAPNFDVILGQRAKGIIWEATLFFFSI